MAKLLITGNGPLHGEVTISGAKNAALPALAAAIMAPGRLRLSNLPPVEDIFTMCSLLRELGLRVELSGDVAEIDGSGLNSHIAPYELVNAMRASILVLGPLLARCGRAQVSLPGGCAIGARPVDLHLAALEKMGAIIRLEHGYIDAQVEGRLRGADIYFEKVTVTGTENIMMAAALAEGTTYLRNAAREPEIEDLAQLLNAMGAKIQGAGGDTITIEGVSTLVSAEHEIIPDRIETGTYVCAAAITGGDVRINRTRPEHLKRFLDVVASAGVPIETGNDWIRVKPHQGLSARDIQTQPHPGFPTDMQAQYMALMTQAEGRSVITENIFENRFNHVPELNRMGARIKVEGHTAIPDGPSRLSGAEVVATDLRASACLVVAALVADGQTRIDKIHHLDRGYFNLEGKLKGLGAKIERLDAQA